MLSQILANGLVSGCFFALVATGFGLIYSSTGIFHLAYAATYVIAAYVCHYCVLTLGWPMAAGALAGVISAALIGAAIELFVYAPLRARGAAPLVFLLSSLGLQVALTNLVALAAGTATIGLRLASARVFAIGGLLLTDIQLLEVGLAAVLLPLVLTAIRVTRLGRHMRAVRDDPVLATVVGIDERRTRLVVFAVGSTLGGVAAILAALDTGMNPTSGMSVLLAGTVAVIIGGVGIWEGPFVGAMILGLVRAAVIWKVSTLWLDAVTFAVFLVFLSIRPTGILGRRTRVEEAAL